MIGGGLPLWIGAMGGGGAGGETYERTFDDGVGITDVATDVKMFTRTLSENMGIADDMGRTQAQLRIIAETLGITDAVVKAEAYALAESLGLTDVVTQIEAFNRTQSETLGITDVVTQVEAFNRTQTESLGLTDTKSHTAAYNRTQTNTIGLTDTKRWFGVTSVNLSSHCGDDSGRTLAEALDGTDFWAHEDEHTHEFIIDLLDSYTVIKVRGRSHTDKDPVDIDVYVSTDGITWGAAVKSNITTWQDVESFVEITLDTPKEGRYIKVEIIATEEGVSKQLEFGDSESSFNIFDAYVDGPISRTVTYSRTLAETLGITDDVIRTLAIIRLFAETLGIADAATNIKTFSRILSDAVGIADEMSRSQVLIRTLADTLGLTDLMSQGAVVTFAETIGITDDFNRLVTFVRTESEILGITDVTSRTATYSRTQTNTLGITDAIIRVAAALRTVDDTVGITDDKSVSHIVGGLVKAAWAFMIIRQTQN